MTQHPAPHIPHPSSNTPSPMGSSMADSLESLMKEDHHVFDRLVGRCRGDDPLRTAVCFPQSNIALTGAVEAALKALIEPVLIGQAREIRRRATVLGLNIDPYEVIDVADETAAARRAIELCRAGTCGALMKGSLHTDALMHQALDPETGLRTARRESHVFVLSTPTYPHILMEANAAITICPRLDDMVDIVQNTIDLACASGIEHPKVAILSAVETVNSKIRSTIDAAALCKMADRGQITGGVLEGPLAFDNAVSLRAAKIKHIDSPVAGAADILVVPDLESGNMLAKQLEYLAEAETAGIVVGARVPIILTSRADGPNARLASCALAVLMSRARHQAPPMQLAV
jgi:phosphate acetyltransferase